jgi:hypothetical protein
MTQCVCATESNKTPSEIQKMNKDTANPNKRHVDLVPEAPKAAVLVVLGTPFSASPPNFSNFS